MNFLTKLEFLKKLEKKLKILDETERKEILSFYYERFDIDEKNNKPEDETLAELGSIDDIAENILVEYGYEKEVFTKKPENFMIKTGIILFDLIIGIWVLLLVLIVGLVCTSGIVFVFSTPVLFFQYNLRDALILFPSTIGLLLFFTFIGLILLELFLIMLKNIIKWHIKIFNPLKKGNFEKIDKLTILPIFKKFKITKKRYIQILVICLLLVSCRYISNFFIVQNFTPSYLYSKEYTCDLENELNGSSTWDISVKVTDTNIKITKTSSDLLKIKRNYSTEKINFDVLFDKENNKIDIMMRNTGIGWFNAINFRFFKLDSSNQSILIEIPEKLLVGNMSIYSTNEEFQLENIKLNNLLVSISNGSVDISDITSNNNISLSTSNETIETKNLQSNIIDIKNRNGQIILKNSLADAITTSTINDDIIVNDVRAKSISSKTLNSLIEYKNVYVESAIMKTRNANIVFINDNNSKKLDKLITKTTNGDVIKNISQK